MENECCLLDYLSTVVLKKVVDALRVTRLPGQVSWPYLCPARWCLGGRAVGITAARATPRGLCGSFASDCLFNGQKKQEGFAEVFLR